MRKWCISVDLEPRLPVFVPLIAWVLLAAMASAQAQAPSAPNRLGQRFVAIPAGTYPMGSSDTPEQLARDFPGYPLERLRDLADEGPAHRVRLPAYELGQTEVTRGQFRRFLAESGHVPQSLGDGGGYGYDPAHRGGDAFAGRDPRYSWLNPGFAQDDEHPVVNVTFHDAQAMAAWLTKVEGRRYRLPTEAEWEVACRAGQPNRWPHGNAPEGLKGQANVFDARSARDWAQWQAFALPHDDGFAFTAPVASFAPNPWGLHDMAGNVWEWVQDWHANYEVPADGVRNNPQGPADGSVRVRRGGSWHTWGLYSRCSYRNWNSEDTRYVLVGFRLARDIAPTTMAQ